MGECVVEQCGKATSRAEFKFCREHWAADRDGLLRTCAECERLIDSGKPLCVACYQKRKRPSGYERGVGGGAPYLSATQLGEEVGLKAYLMNRALQEMGWIDQVFEGWEPTPRGMKQGAKKKEHQSGNTYVVWPRSVVDSAVFKRVVADFRSEAITEAKDSVTATEIDSTPIRANSVPQVQAVSTPLTVLAREKFRGNIRTMDGHFVQSRAEALIDNWLYQARLIHSYEKALPIDGDALCDFYLPDGTTVYIEYWGVKGDAGYDARRDEKQKIYAAAGLPLIELTDEHINNLDDYLPRMLIKHAIKPK